MKWKDYVKIQVFVLHQNGRDGKMGKTNDKMENITSGWLFLCWFQHDISMVLRNQEISKATGLGKNDGR